MPGIGRGADARARTTEAESYVHVAGAIVGADAVTTIAVSVPFGVPAQFVGLTYVPSLHTGTIVVIAKLLRALISCTNGALLAALGSAARRSA